MPKNPIQSDAFSQAALTSERQRVTGLLILIGAVMFIALLRFALAGFPRDEAAPVLMNIVVIALAGGFETLMLAKVKHAQRAGGAAPNWIWPLSVVVECTLPTVLILIMTIAQYPGPYRSLVGPAVLMYPLFIVLSTLRLSPALAILSGVVCALGFSGVLGYTLWRFPIGDPDHAVLRLSVLMMYPAALLIIGAAAAGIAARIREHVRAALREAEVQRQMDRMKHDLSIARSIQQGLLPSDTVTIPRYEVTGWNQPADETGGDYFDWQELPGGRLVVSLADATGHGIGPALVTSVCRAYARACLDGDADLNSSMMRVNALLARDLPPDRFVTFVAMLLDPNSHQIHMLSAGHGPMFHYVAATGEIRELQSQGVPLAVAPDIPFEPSARIELATGDFFAVFTDGFFEWRGPNDEEFGTQRLTAALIRHADESASGIIEKVRAEVAKFVGDHPQNDDLTAVIIKRSSQ